MCVDTWLVKCSSNDSTRRNLAPICWLSRSGALSGSSWLVHLVPRLLQPLQTADVGASNSHRTLRRLHSQQLAVPFRSFLFFGAGLSSAGGDAS